MTGPLNRITAALYSTTDALHDTDQATNSAFNSAGIQAITQELYGYERKIQDIQDELDRSNNKIQEMQEQTEKARSSAGGLENAFRKAAGILATVATVQTLKNVLDTSDELTAITARLEMMNNGFESVGGNLKSTSDLFNLVYASAQDARGSFEICQQSLQNSEIMRRMLLAVRQRSLILQILYKRDGNCRRIHDRSFKCNVAVVTGIRLWRPSW